MLAIPNYPVRRLWNTLRDEPYSWNQWLVFPRDDVEFEQTLTLPNDPEAKAKEVDPNWRRNWSWILLRSLGPEVYYPIRIDLADDRFVERSYQPLYSKYFAMRIGPKPVKVVTVDLDGNFSVPEIFLCSAGQPYISSASYIKLFTQTEGLEVTFI